MLFSRLVTLTNWRRPSCCRGHRSTQVVRYNGEGCGLDSRLCLGSGVSKLQPVGSSRSTGQSNRLRHETLKEEKSRFHEENRQLNI